MDSVAQGVICIGGSAGALTVIDEILGGLDPSIGVPIVIVLHRLPRYPDTLSRSLQARSRLPVVDIGDQCPITSGTVHLVPGGYHVLVGKSHFVLTLEPAENFCIPSIDVLFETAADSYGDSAVAIALSCSNDDGARGARWIKQRGGTLVVQDPATAEHGSLIAAILRSTTPDYSLSPAGIADLINSRTASSRTLTGPLTEMNGDPESANIAPSAS